MTDILFLIVTIGFFAACTLLVRACDGIIGGDSELSESGLTSSDPSAGTEPAAEEVAR